MLVRRAPRPRHLARGFTLVELGIVLVIVAIVGMVATPGFRAFIDAMDAKTASMELVTDLTAARSEALKRNAAVTVVPVDGNWNNGWRVGSGGTVLGQRSALRPGVSVSAPSAGVRFEPNGRLGTDDTAVDNVRWSVASSHGGAQARCVVITPTGSARSMRGECP